VTGSADDHGAADPRLTAALESGDLTTVQSTLLEVRVLVPVVATGEDGMAAEQAVPRLVNDAGKHALPVFSSYDALRAWRPEGRPVPMTGSQVVAAAIAEGYDAIVLDVAGPISVALPVAGPAGKPPNGPDSPRSHPH
jgi:hypothetical protein